MTGSPHDRADDQADDRADDRAGGDHATSGAAGPGGAGEGPRASAPEDVLAGRYVLQEELGRGGMAVVRAAQDRVLGRRVAVKVLRADLARDEAFQERFRREARSAAALNHPSVVRVHDVGEGVLPPGDEPVPFIVMELVRGATVRAVLDERRREAPDDAPGGPAGSGGTAGTTVLGTTSPAGGPAGGPPEGPGVGVDLAVTITAGVLEALAFSHRAGIVHRDIKPANVMLTPEGHVTVMDFGIARALADTSVTTTHAAAVLGTAQYLSPEQARGRPVDARTDLYSTGCLLFELLTGRPLFQGDSAVSLAYQHVGEEPDPPSAHHPGLAPALDRVTARALAKDPEDRYPDADAFRLDLLAAADGTATPAEVAAAAATTTAAEPVDPPAAVALPPAPEEDPPPDRGRRAVVVLVALVVLALVAAAAVVLPRLSGDDAPVLASVPDVVGQTSEAAQASVERVGLGYAATTASSPDVPEGRVVEQDPAAAAQVSSGSTVDVVVSSGPATVAVPDVVGSTEQRARAALADAGLEVGEVGTAPDPTTRQGSVVSVEPSTGSTVPTGSEVDLVLSDGTVEIDDYTGLPLATARAALSALDLQGSLEYEVSDEAENTVLDQDPGPGAVPQGSTVALVVAEPAPPVATVTQTPTPTPTTTPTPTPAPTPTSTGTPTATPTATATPTGTPTTDAPPTPTQGPTTPGG